MFACGTTAGYSFFKMPLSPELEQHRSRIIKVAQEYGLDFYDVVFESVTYDEMNMIAAYGGFPTRYPHWKFGMEYEQLARSYEYGLSKIYELVINNDPSYAYLMAANEVVDQKLVMSHVYGHVDFFKNNFSFAHTDRKMMDTMANHGTKIRRYIDRYGMEKVEGFIDCVLSLDNLIDRHAPFIQRSEDKQERPERDAPLGEVAKLRADREYMQGYINPKEFIEEQRQKMVDDHERELKIPERPERDVLLFLLKHAPLENWERDILSMLRDEAYYFSPQGQTKIMNEGWASFWHTTIMTQKILDDSEVIDYADRHAGTMGVQPGSINPYKLGLELFRNIEDRWNKGQYGPEWDQCNDLAARHNWDTKAMNGREKIFEVRRHYNDVTFIDEFLTPEFAQEYKMFNYGYNQKTDNWEILNREFRQIKYNLLGQLTNFGQPFIAITDGNFENRGELLLEHLHEGVDLREDYMRDTLLNLSKLWSRPVLMQTKRGDQSILVSCDGGTFKETDIESAP